MRIRPILLATHLLAGCGPSPAQTQALATAVSDAASLAADIQAEVAVAQTKGTLPGPTVAATQAQMARLQADLGAFSTGGTTADSVLADVKLVITTVGPFIPAIAALLAVAAPHDGAPAPSKIRLDFAQFRADVVALKDTKTTSQF